MLWHQDYFRAKIIFFKVFELKAKTECKFFSIFVETLKKPL